MSDQDFKTLVFTFIIALVFLQILFNPGHCQDTTKAKFDTLKFEQDFRQMHQAKQWPFVEEDRLVTAGLVLGSVTAGYLLKEEPFWGFTIAMFSFAVYDIHRRDKILRERYLK